MSGDSQCERHRAFYNDPTCNDCWHEKNAVVEARQERIDARATAIYCAWIGTAGLESNVFKGRTTEQVWIEAYMDATEGEKARSLAQERGA